MNSSDAKSFLVCSSIVYFPVCVPCCRTGTQRPSLRVVYSRLASVNDRAVIGGLNSTSRGLEEEVSKTEARAENVQQSYLHVQASGPGRLFQVTSHSTFTSGLPTTPRLQEATEAWMPTESEDARL